MKKGLQPLVDKILKHGLLVPCQSLCNTPILPIVKPKGEYRVVQDLRAVVPIHLLLSSHNILTQIPEDTTRVSVRSLVVSSGIWVNTLWLARRGRKGTTLFSWAPKSLQMVIAAMELKDACSLEEKFWPTYQHIKKQRHYFDNKGPSIQGYGFSSGHVWMWNRNFTHQILTRDLTHSFVCN